MTPGTARTLTTSGGSRSGAVSWKVATGSDCWLIWSSNRMLLDGSVGTVCSLTAKKAASSGYLQATSGEEISKVAISQTALSVSNTTTTGTAGATVTLTTPGGQGSGAVTYRLRSHRHGMLVDRDERGVMQCHRDEGGVDNLFRGNERGKDLCQLPRFGFLDASASRPGTAAIVTYTAPNTSMGWSSFKVITSQRFAGQITTATTTASTTSTSNPGTLSVTNLLAGATITFAVPGTTKGG
jgi:hypothetical protein